MISSYLLNTLVLQDLSSHPYSIIDIQNVFQAMVETIQKVHQSITRKEKRTMQD